GHRTCRLFAHVPSPPSIVADFEKNLGAHPPTKLRFPEFRSNLINPNLQREMEPKSRIRFRMRGLLRIMLFLSFWWRSPRFRLVPCVRSFGSNIHPHYTACAGHD